MNIYNQLFFFFLLTVKILIELYLKIMYNYLNFPKNSLISIINTVQSSNNIQKLIKLFINNILSVTYLLANDIKTKTLYSIENLTDLFKNPKNNLSASLRSVYHLTSNLQHPAVRLY